MRSTTEASREPRREMIEQLRLCKAGDFAGSVPSSKSRRWYSGRREGKENRQDSSRMVCGREV